MLTQTIHSFIPADSAIQAKRKLNPLIEDIQNIRGIGTMPFLHLPHETDDIEELLARIITYRETCDHVVLCGTGGSSLGALMLASLHVHPLGLPQAGSPQLHVIESTNRETLHAAMHQLPPERTGWLFISKSGTTLETITQFLAFLKWQENLSTGPVTVITMPGERPIRTLAQRYHINVLDHAPELGGRFSVLSNVGLLPAGIMGLDIALLRDGAASMLETEGLSMAAEAAIWQYHCIESGQATQIVMPYAKRLSAWTLWYRQLWAESLGKDGKGSTPLAANGPVDQHSMLQLFLDGPKDKSFTLVKVKNAARETPLAISQALPELRYLASCTASEIINAQASGTLDAVRNRHIPAREITLDVLDEYTLGKLLMLGMLETVMTAELLGVNAFDQPAVEEGKRITFGLLEGKQSVIHGKEAA